MANLTDPRIIWLKGALFLMLGLLASGLLLAQLPDIRYAAVLAIAIWAFCRSMSAFRVESPKRGVL
ncbi:MAG: hypothetical protein MUF23_10235 [Pirellula sp.]|jgi:hypothetical protein|nr:hypothetical protein [Pirellula sp.]